MNWDNSVDIMTNLRAVRAGIRGLTRGWNNRRFSSPESRIRRVSVTPFPEGNRQGRQATACYVSGDEIYIYIAD